MADERKGAQAATPIPAAVTVVFRPIGGWLSDRIHPAVVTAFALGLVSLLAVVQAFDPKLNPIGTICFLGMAAGLGAASGSEMALAAAVYAYARMRGARGAQGAQAAQNTRVAQTPQSAQGASAV
jgi:MFS transporter, NNP family, nitrate/nitrite transporter